MLTELHIRILASKRPLDGSLRGISSLLPRVNLALQTVSAFNAPVQTLATEDADFDLRHVEPTAMFGRVMDFETLTYLARLLGRDPFPSPPEE